MGGREIPYTWGYYEDEWEPREDEPGWYGVGEDDWDIQFMDESGENEDQIVDDYYDEWEAAATIVVDTYHALMDALGYPRAQIETATFEEVLADVEHMIDLGHRYLDLME